MRIKPEETALIPVDIQERLMPAIHDGEELVKRCAMLIQGMKILEVPILVPRQYPKGIGDTRQEIREAVGEHTPFDKLCFSVCDDEAFLKALKALQVKNVVLCGAEAHVCVLQTAIDLVAQGFRPILVCDCIGSRKPADKATALLRAQQEGVLLTSAEAILFELTRVAGNDRFKAISKLVK